jgi:hypothetical protein
VGWAASGLFTSAMSLANGRYPTANQVAFDPIHADHFVVGTTFGLLESRDRGSSFGWACDPALSIVDQEDGMFAITASSETVIATFTGIAFSADGCTYQKAPDLDQKIVPDLSLSRSSPHHLLAFHMVRADDGTYESQVVSSDDDGHTWTSLGSPLPPDLLPLTIDIAPSDPQRVYLSGRLDKSDQYASGLLNSHDVGNTFERVVVPGTSGFRNAYIAAVDPLDADHVFVRVDQTGGTVVLASRDGGKTFVELFRGAGQLLGFALANTGRSLALGGPQDGLWVGPSDGTSFERRSDVGPTCLGYQGEALYVCANFKTAGFSIARTFDQGATFEPLLRFDALCGGSTCGAASGVGELCPSEWRKVAPALGATCGIDGGVDRPRDGAPTWEATGGCQLAWRSHNEPSPFYLLALIAGFAMRSLHRSRGL